MEAGARLVKEIWAERMCIAQNKILEAQISRRTKSWDASSAECKRIGENLLFDEISRRKLIARREIMIHSNQALIAIQRIRRRREKGVAGRSRRYQPQQCFGLRRGIRKN